MRHASNAGTPSASPAVIARRSEGSRPIGPCVGDEAVLRRRHAQHLHALGPDRLQPPHRVEALVLQQRDRAAQPGRDERVAGRLRPARRGGRPDELARLRRHPLRRLQALPPHVALAVRHQLGLAARPGREEDEGGVERRRGRPHQAASPPASSDSSGNGQHRTRRRRRVQHRPVALVAQHQRRTGAAQAQRDVLRAQLLAARQGRDADPQAGQDRQHVLDAVADQRQHGRPALHAVRQVGRGQRPEARRATRRTSTRAGRPSADSVTTARSSPARAPTTSRTKFTPLRQRQRYWPVPRPPGYLVVAGGRGETAPGGMIIWPPGPTMTDWPSLVPAGQRPTAHLLELCPRGHLLGEQRRLDAVEEPLEPADELRLGDAQFGLGRARPRRTGS